MTDHLTPLLTSLDLQNPVKVATSSIATIWRVERAGSLAALKIWHGLDMDNEAAGLGLLAAKDGHASVRLIEQRPGAVVMEWLEGPSAGDLSRAGDDDAATEVIAAVAARFHAKPVDPTGLPTLADWCADLFALHCSSDCAHGLKASIKAAQVLAKALLDSTTQTTALHGDLHHDNIRSSARGWLVHDAKGVQGDLAYELANAFRNPLGADALIRTPQRALHMSARFAAALGIDPVRLMGWAAVHCALSIAWSSKGPLSNHTDADVLAMLLGLADQA